MSKSKVIIAYDGSNGSKLALNHAVDYFNGELEVVTVRSKKDLEPDALALSSQKGLYFSAINGGVHPIREVMEEEPKKPDEELEFQVIRQRHDQELYKKRQDLLRQAKGVIGNKASSIQAEVLYDDDPADAICKHAIAKKADLIVMGHRGLSGIKKLVLGSVSEKVVQHADCSVYVVK